MSGAWSPYWVHPARRPLIGLLYLPRVIVRMEWGFAWETDVIGENLHQHHFVHHKSNLTIALPFLNFVLGGGESSASCLCSFNTEDTVPGIHCIGAILLRVLNIFIHICYFQAFRNIFIMFYEPVTARRKYIFLQYPLFWFVLQFQYFDPCKNVFMDRS
jgi:hypothetical protein